VQYAEFLLDKILVCDSLPAPISFNLYIQQRVFTSIGGYFLLVPIISTSLHAIACKVCRLDHLG
jgi:hypothetical protein